MNMDEDDYFNYEDWEIAEYGEYNEESDLPVREPKRRKDKGVVEE